jgi:hypothetical protein
VVDNSTGLNQGMVSISGLNAFGISSTGNGSTLANQGTVTTTGSRGFGLDARGSNSMLINSGTINVSGPGIRSTATFTSAFPLFRTRSAAARHAIDLLPL